MQKLSLGVAIENNYVGLIEAGGPANLTAMRHPMIDRQANFFAFLATLDHQSTQANSIDHYCVMLVLNVEN